MWHFLWHSIWHPFWHFIFHIHIFRLSIWQIFWISIPVILYHIYSDIVSGSLSDTWHLFWAFFLPFILTCLPVGHFYRFHACAMPAPARRSEGEDKAEARRWGQGQGGEEDEWRRWRRRWRSCTLKCKDPHLAAGEPSNGYFLFSFFRVIPVLSDVNITSSLATVRSLARSSRIWMIWIFSSMMHQIFGSVAWLFEVRPGAFGIVWAGHD